LVIGSYRQVGRIAFWQEENKGLGTDNHLSAVVKGDVEVAGEVRKLWQEKRDGACRFWDYDISLQALEMCKSRVNERLQFKLADISQEKDTFFDLLLVLDVIEHVEDAFGFLNGIRPKSGP